MPSIKLVCGATLVCIEYKLMLTRCVAAQLYEIYNFIRKSKKAKDCRNGKTFYKNMVQTWLKKHMQLFGFGLLLKKG